MPIEIKKLNINNHVEIYQNFLNSFSYAMKVPRRGEIDARAVLGATDRITVAAFKDNEIVASLTGVFPINRPYWLGKNLFVQTTEIGSGLGNYDESIFLIMDLFNPLISYGESIGVYNFYTRKNVKHQLSYEKLVQRLKSRLSQDKINSYRMLQYEVFYEIITPEKFINKDENFRWRNYYSINESTDAEAMVILHTLNQNERKKILGLL